MADFFDPFSDPRRNRNRRTVTRPVRRETVQSPQTSRLSLELHNQVENFKQLVAEQAKTIELQREQLKIKSDAIRQQTEDVKRLDTELLWTRAALEETAKNAQVSSNSAEIEKSWQERYARLQADMDNTRKRLDQRADEKTRDERNRIIKDMLPLADHLELALHHAESQMESNNGGSPTETDQYHSFVQNIRATLAAFLSTLKRYDVMPIEAYGKPFDPTQHEAIGQVESAEIPADAVAKVMQTGYMDGERLLRPSLVMISKGK